MSFDLRVLTLNCWAIPIPYPIGSKHRQYRLDAIIARLRKGEFDIIALEEIWSSSDYMRIRDALRGVYDHTHYFRSGFIGSGICILSKQAFVDIAMHRFSVNGYPHHVHRGDWHGGKAVGMVRLIMENGFKVAVYATHLHAEYDPKANVYLPHRVVQAYELSQFVKLTAQGSDMVIVLGDFNFQPFEVGYKLVLANAGLKDAWIERKSGAESELCETTFFVPENSFTSSRFNRQQRIDYILWRNSNDFKVTAESCHTDFHKIPGEDINYSDHEGVVATFAVERQKDKLPSQYSVDRSSYLPELLQDAIDIINDSQHAVWSSRLYYIIAYVLLSIVYFGTIGLEIGYPSLAFIIMSSRFTITLVIGFVLLYGIVFLTMERNGLKNAEGSMKVLLKSKIRELAATHHFKD